MQHEHVEKVKSLLATALARPVSEREAYLDAACAGDPALRRDVDQYLTSGDKTEQFVYHPADTDPEDGPTLENLDPHIGKEVGKYSRSSGASLRAAWALSISLQTNSSAARSR